MRLILTIGAGSFIGGILRYLISLSVQSKVLSTFPYGTLTVNVAGCLLIGLVYGLSDRFTISPEMRLFLATGILGGFTTFSAFSNETIGMLRDGQYWMAGIYIAVSIILGLLATIGGIVITKIF